MPTVKHDVNGMPADPLWYKDAIIYELHVKAFCDGNGDGIGDFPGLCTKLDYLQDLGVTALWLLPFYPSPLRDDGYDIADYYDVHPNYGTLRDFKAFLKEAHRRGLRVITELVVNHTSSEHPWFQRARRSPPHSPQRDFYVWSDTPDRYAEARIIFPDFESSNWAWDSLAKAYYWHRFYSHQPDLNYDNPRVQKAVLQVLDFWFGMGVDGLRLDAVPYLFQRDGTNCENLPETHAFLKKLRRHIDAKFDDRMLLAEANQWPEDAVVYFGEGDECHMAFHFPVMPRMFMAVQLEDRFPLIDILEQTPAIPEAAQWALFLRNHDELTLEMVTDEDRDYMYRVYAHEPRARINLGIRRRLAPLLENRRKLELLNGLLFAFPGTPVIYYADEIGMGDNIYLGDRDGVRTPMQWSCDRNAGFSGANPQRLYLPIIIDPEYHYEACNVETQQKNPHSLLWWMKRLIALRKRHRAFGRGTIEFLDPDNRKVLAFIRAWGEERILVIANLSRFSQYAELDLSEFAGSVPYELFGHTPFPAIGKRPYFVTLGPHTFHYFMLMPRRVTGISEEARRQRVHLEVTGSWTHLFAGDAREAFEKLLPGYLVSRRWFGGKGRKIKSARVSETVPFPLEGRTAMLVAVEARYREERPETYILPLAFVSGAQAESLEHSGTDTVLARLRVLPARGKHRGESDTMDGVVYDALSDRELCLALLDAIARRRRLRGTSGVLEAIPTRAFKALYTDAESLEPRISRAEQSNTSVIFADRFILKMFRRSEEGTSPDLEIGRFLTEKCKFANAPPVAGALEYRRDLHQPVTVALLQGFVANQGDAWRFTLDALSRYFERVVAEDPPTRAALPLPPADLAKQVTIERPVEAVNTIGPYLAMVELLGKRTAELHVALASAKEDAVFAPEKFTTLYQRSLYQSIRTRCGSAFDLLRRRLRAIPRHLRERARAVLAQEDHLKRRIKAVTSHKIAAMRTRTHGDYHLGQVLFTGSDFVIIDFEGEPARSMGERKLKRSPLRDVAGMLRSFHYVAISALTDASIRQQDISALMPWADFWHRWVSAEFIRAYHGGAVAGGFLPASLDDFALFLDVYLLEKASYELEYELNNRPDWLHIPIDGLLQLLGTTDSLAK